MGETKRQKDRKNGNRVPAKDRALYPSTQRNYSKPKPKEMPAQSTIF